MSIYEYDAEKQRLLDREEGRKEGRAEGREEGREEGRKEGREEGRKEGREEELSFLKLQASQLADNGCSAEEILRKLGLMGKEDRIKA